MRIYNVKNHGEEKMLSLPKEINLHLFKKINKINTNPNFENIDKYLATFEILGLTSEYIDKMDSKALFTTIKDFQEDFITTGMTNIIEIDGYTYKAYDDEFMIGARDFAKIENKMINNEEDWFIYALAIIFKRTDLSLKEHTDKAHIDHKKKLFEEKMTMDIALPYILFISKEYIDNITILAANVG
jgi:hypothetical protein